MALNQLQRDLRDYTEGKLYNMIKDVTQAFQIAGRQRDVLGCLMATYIKAAAMITVQVYGNGTEEREKFLEACAYVFDQEAKDPNPMMKGE